MEIKDIINARRKELDLTMKQVADAVGVSEGTVSRWESGDIENIRKDKLPLLAKTLKIPLPRLMGLGDYPFAVGKALSEICDEKGATLENVSERSGVELNKINRLIQDEFEPVDIPTVKALCDALNVGFSRLLIYNTNLLSREWNETMAKYDSNLVNQLSQKRLVPVYGRVAAGVPIEAIENILDFEEIPAHWFGDYAALKVKGDSMAPRILENDILIVKLQDDADSGDIVVAIVNGQDATVKKLIKHPDGITLQAFNPAYEPMYFSKEKMNEIPVTIWGKVVENRAKF